MGTMTSNMNARVEKGMVIFEAENYITLTSAAAGNVTGGALNPLINSPQSGAYSPVLQKFRLEIPVANIKNATYSGKYR